LIRRRTPASSSTISHHLVAARRARLCRGARSASLVGHDREVDAEHGPVPELAVDGDLAFGLAHDAVDGGEAQPGAAADPLRREEGLEDLLDQQRVDASASVGDRDHRAALS
jgi:hypothetical protein